MAVPSTRHRFLIEVLRFETSWATADPKTFGMETIK